MAESGRPCTISANQKYGSLSEWAAGLPHGDAVPREAVSGLVGAPSIDGDVVPGSPVSGDVDPTSCRSAPLDPVVVVVVVVVVYLICKR